MAIVKNCKGKERKTLRDCVVLSSALGNERPSWNLNGLLIPQEIALLLSGVIPEVIQMGGLETGALRFTSEHGRLEDCLLDGGACRPSEFSCSAG